MKIKLAQLILLVLGFQANIQGQAYWVPVQKETFEIDAKAENWLSLTYAEDSSYAYAFSHNNPHLHVCLQVFDLKLQNHILLTGMTLWLDETGKKKQKKGIHYPTGYKQQEILRDPMRFREILEAIQLQKHEIAEKLVSLELVNFVEKGSRTWGKAFNPDAIQIKLDFAEDGSMIYEANIPLALVFENSSVYTDKNSKGFSLGWETGELGRPELRGDDAVGLSGSNPANPTKFNTDWDRSFQRELNIYRSYAVPEKIWIKRVILQ